jgi:glucose-1-phosphatase
MKLQKENVRVLLFDLGNVIINIDFARAINVWSHYAKLKPETLKSRFSLDASYERHERNEITGKEYFASLRELLGINLTNTQMEEGWNAINVGEVATVREVLHQAKQNFPVYAFSNTNPTHWAHLSSHYSEVLSVFQKVFTSFELKKRKPHKEAFEVVIKEIGVNAENILFFDDLLENVEGARAAGLQAVHVQSIADTREALEYLPTMR